MAPSLIQVLLGFVYNRAGAGLCNFGMGRSRTWHLHAARGLHAEWAAHCGTDLQGVGCNGVGSDLKDHLV